ncbi:MAG: hypothetical protein WEC99_11220, partial [Halofilum sp. (in: g-proteobacteria)]
MNTKGRIRVCASAISVSYPVAGELADSHECPDEARLGRHVACAGTRLSGRAPFAVQTLSVTREP